MDSFANTEQLHKITDILSKYIRLPFSDKTIPGAVLESVLAYVRNGEVLNTYDYIDVYNSKEKVGWQVKCTKASTPVTWKRAKIPNKHKYIEESLQSKEGLQKLGDAIIKFCNDHALESIEKYNLEEIGYCRLVIHDDGRVTYFERSLCTRKSPQIFNPSDFEWRWSTPKVTKKKEQLSALHGIHKTTGSKWWAWHGSGENQLHFSGESTWWPKVGDPHAVSFNLPTEREKLSLEEFFALLARAKMPD